MIAALSHDLRTPVTIIQGHVESLSRTEAGEKRNERLERYLPVLSASSQRMTRLLNDFLVVSALEETSFLMHPEPIDIADALRHKALDHLDLLLTVVFAIAFSPAGRSVYLGGHFGLVNDVARNEAAAVPLSDGSAVLGFNPDIYAPANCVGCTTPETSRVYQMIVTNSRVYTCGGYWRVNGSRRSFNVSAFDPDTGALDPSFTVQDDGDTPGCALRGSVLYVGGHFNFAGPDCQPTHLEPCAIRHHVAAIDTVTSTLLPAGGKRGVWPWRLRSPAG
jgi:hypothetical protein